MRSGQKRLGFSLIELLTVIAVIAILATLIIASIQRVRTTAALSKSISNLRSLQLANSLYSSEHNGWYVPIASWTDEGEAVFWHNDPKFRAYFSLEPGNNWPSGLVAPKAEITTSSGNLRLDRAYGYNITSMNGKWAEAGQGYQVNRSEIPNLDNKMAFADALDWIIHRDNADDYNGEEVYTKHAIAYRYNGSAGVVYYSGRATGLPREEVIENRGLWDICED